MRRCLFCLLIVLTAMRGMVGDVMALEMSHLHSDRAVVVAQEVAASHSHAQSHPCHDAPAHGQASEHGAGECNACQVCHSPVLQVSRPFFGQEPLAAAYAAQPVSKWMSAELAQSQKPPVF